MVARLGSLLSRLLLVSLVASSAAEARAEVYKFKKGDGSVVYTDRIDQLPADRRRFYERQEAERAARRRELEAKLGKEELARREAEEQKKALEREQLAAAERARRMQALDAVLAEARARDAEREKQKAAWQARAKKAREDVQRLLGTFRETQAKYDELAVRADFTLLPGQGQEKAELAATLARLEQELDAAIDELENRLPEEARVAGIPPGWIR